MCGGFVALVAFVRFLLTVVIVAVLVALVALVAPLALASARGRRAEHDELEALVREDSHPRAIEKLQALLDPDDEVIILSPFFVEYHFYVDNHDKILNSIS